MSNGRNGGSRIIEPILYRPGVTSHHDVTNSLEVRRTDRRQLIAECARHVLETNLLLTPKQRQAFHDLCRADVESRYSLKLLDLLLDGMANAANPMLLSEKLRAATLQMLAAPSLCVVETWLDEARKQGAADPQHDQFIVERTGVRRDQALEFLVPHREALQTAIDALHTWTPNGRRIIA